MENRESAEKQHRIPLALVALVLYSVALVRFLTTFISGFSVDKLIGGLVGLAIQTGMTTAFVLIVVWARARRKKKRRSAQV